MARESFAKAAPPRNSRSGASHSDEHSSRHPGESGDEAEKKIILVGNPNVGKSVVFKNLTGQRVIISN